MPTFKFVVFTNAVEGRDAEFNDWYTGQHVPDILKVKGYVGAQRFQLVDLATNAPGANRYLALYDIEADDAQSAMDALIQAGRDGVMVMSDSMDSSSAKTIMYTPITPLMTKS
jgi:hypothetical protein